MDCSFEGRRQFFDKDAGQYIKNVVEGNDQIENMITQIQEDILREIHVDSLDFQNSIFKLAEQGLYQNVYLIQASMRFELKQKVVSRRKVTQKQTEEFIKF